MVNTCAPKLTNLHGPTISLPKGIHHHSVTPAAADSSNVPIGQRLHLGRLSLVKPMPVPVLASPRTQPRPAHHLTRMAVSPGVHRPVGSQPRRVVDAGAHLARVDRALLAADLDPLGLLVPLNQGGERMIC